MGSDPQLNPERVERGLEADSESFVASSREFAGAQITFGILQRLEDAGLLPADEKKRVLVAFGEALVNAHEHGNLELRSEWRDKEGAEGRDLFSEMKDRRLRVPQYGDRKLQVRVSFDGVFLALTVRDEGPGYNPIELREGSAGSDTASHGRGLRLIRHFMDEVLIHEGGRLLELRKRLVFP